MSDWNPEQYLKFENDRNKPIIDLLNHIELKSPKRIIDIGCGPGNSTGFLARQWPQAEVIGLDSSAAMLEVAKRNFPELKWVQHDATNDISHLGKFDLVLSNAAMHWMQNHDHIVPGFFNLLNPGGVLAVQIPHNYDSPLDQALQAISNSEKWRDQLSANSPVKYYPAGYYYDILSNLTADFEIWITRYHHILNFHEDIIEWYQGTGFRPYLNQLDEKGKVEFLTDILVQVKQLYTPQVDGKIIFDFKRLFFMAYMRFDNNCIY